MLEDYSRASRIIESGLEYDPATKLLIPPNVTTESDHMAIKLLPPNLKEFEKLKSATSSHEDRKEYLARSQLEVRSSDWIKSNGICLENIMPRPSTIAGAGRGGFLQDKMRKGDTLALAPLMHVLDRTI